MYNPVVWSIWPSTRTIAAMAQSRTARAGCSSGLAWSCAVISGEAFTSTQQAAALPATAIEDCVRACARSVPFLKPAQLSQLQFHCGKPPPAADPRTRIFTAIPYRPIVIFPGDPFLIGAMLRAYAAAR
jgi:hypothetical protein